MPYDWTIQTAWSDGTGDTATRTRTVSAEDVQKIQTTLTAGQVDKRVNVSIDVSELKGLVITSNVALTIQTNDGTTPANTITVAANTPYVWDADSGVANPLTVDVTALYLTNGDGDNAGAVTIRLLKDPTP